MLNSYTLTSTFRGAQYDIRVFLETLLQIVSASSEESAQLIESHWSDGSVDVTPSVALVNDMVPNTFTYVTVGGTVISVVRGFGLFISSALRANYDSINALDGNLNFTSCRIDNLIADNIQIDDSEIDLDTDSIGQLSTDSLVSRDIGCTDFKYDNVSSVNMDISLVYNDVRISLQSQNVGSSQLLNYCRVTEATTYDTLTFTGPASLIEKGSNGNSLRILLNESLGYSTLCRIGVPVYGVNGGMAYTAYDATNVNDVYAWLTPEYGIGLLALYPRVTCSQSLDTTSSKAKYTFIMNDLEPEDDYKIIRVRNESFVSIKACNVWLITAINTRALATIVPVSFVYLPPRSNIDFLLVRQPGNEANARFVKMMPMKNISTMD